MHPSRSRLVTTLTVASAAIWVAAAVTVALIPSHRKIAPMAAAASPAPEKTDADEPQISTRKSDRLPLAQPSPPAPAEPPAIQPADAADLAQAEQDQRRTSRARAETRDLCERHGLRKVWTSRYAWRCR